jgi:hypothetical protein
MAARSLAAVMAAMLAFGVPAIADARKGLCVWAGLSALVTLAAEVAVLLRIQEVTDYIPDAYRHSHEAGDGLAVAIVATAVLVVVFFVAAWHLPGWTLIGRRRRRASLMARMAGWRTDVRQRVWAEHVPPGSDSAPDDADGPGRAARGSRGGVARPGPTGGPPDGD